jgi:hypothetical protein
MSEIDGFAAALLGCHPIGSGKSLWIRYDCVDSAGRTFHLSPCLNDDVHPPEKHNQFVHPSPVCELRPTLRHSALPPPPLPARALSLARTRTQHNFSVTPVEDVLMSCGYAYLDRPDSLP